MKIIINSRVFPPEGHPTAIMMSQLAKYLAEKGWEVKVYAGYPTHPKGILYDNFQKSLIAREELGQAEVVRTWHPTHGNRSVPMRVGLITGQVLSNSMAGFIGGGVDVILTVGFPIIGPYLWKAVAIRHRAKLVNVVYDIYPDIAVENRHIRNKTIIRIAKGL